MTDKKRKALTIIIVVIMILALVGTLISVIYLINNYPPKSDSTIGVDSTNSSQDDSSSKDDSVTNNKPSNNETSNKKPSDKEPSDKEPSKNNSKNNSTTDKAPAKSEEVSSADNEKLTTQLVKAYEFIDELSSDLEARSFYDSKSGHTVPYRLALPTNFSANKKYPVILFLHGAGELGTDNSVQLKNFSCAFNVVPDLLSQAILIFPQSNYGWDANHQRTGYLDATKRLLDSIITQYRGDSDRIYLTGLSLGSFATWRMLEAYPDTFAAAVPVCGGAGYYAPEVFVNTPIWIYHGTADETVHISTSEQTYKAIEYAGGTLVNFSRLDGVGHNAWDYAYTDRNMFSWLFAQNKKTHQSLSYKYQCCFKVTTPNEEIVITEEDINTVSLWYDDGKRILECDLTQDGAENLKRAYKNNIGKVFGLYYYGQKLCDFKVLAVPVDDVFTVEFPQDNVDLDALY